ncbi:MAG: DUF4268 domain-containing protein [Hymenobacteraceae bacterium]|nr:DUF4268 domain-containing protein [Hymenobacteraceae bacterium]
MYSKAEAAQRRQAFWTALGQYMAPVPAAAGEPTHWINYRTGLKHVYFRLHADQRHARIAIELLHPDAAVREVFYEQLAELKPALEEVLGEPWTWEPATTDTHGQPLARVSQELSGANLFEQADWPRLISFFKPRLIGLDAFWNGNKWAFEELL